MRALIERKIRTRRENNNIPELTDYFKETQVSVEKKLSTK